MIENGMSNVYHNSFHHVTYWSIESGDKRWTKWMDWQKPM